MIKTNCGLLLPPQIIPLKELSKEGEVINGEICYGVSIHLCCKFLAPICVHRMGNGISNDVGCLNNVSSSFLGGLVAYLLTKKLQVLVGICQYGQNLF